MQQIKNHGYLQIIVILCAINLRGVTETRLPNGSKILKFFKMDYCSKHLKYWKKYGFLAKISSHITGQKLRDSDRAYMEKFDKKQLNKQILKKCKKQLHNSFRLAQDFEIDNHRVKLPKIE